jgi:hypothetical protein
MRIDPAAAPSQRLVPEDRVTFVPTGLLSGEFAAGDVLLDGDPIGRVSRRLLPAHIAAYRALDLYGRRALDDKDVIWHVEAIGWVPRSDRPWDRRITRSAPTRRRAIEDLLRAYGNRR